MKSLRTVLWVVGCISLLSSHSWGWGKTGHFAIELVAARLMPPSPLTDLIKNNTENINYLCFVPDVPWKHGSTPPHPLEGQSHFFTTDFYSPSGQPIPKDFPSFLKKYGKENVLKYGTAPWRARQMFLLLTKVLKQPHISPIAVLQATGVMGHYIGDLGNPLHVVADFDGHGAGAPGLHSFFETTTVEEFNFNTLVGSVRETAVPFLKAISNDVDPIDGTFMLAENGRKNAAILLSSAKKWGLSPMLQRSVRPMIVRTMAISSALLAKLWYEAWVDAGKPNFPTQTLNRIATPNWIPLNYLH